jgi:CRP-like cAMP-binding protein
MLTGTCDFSPLETRPFPRPVDGTRASPAFRSAPSGRIRNGLLEALPSEALERLIPYLERVPLKKRQILHERNIPVSHGYFIEHGTASLLSRVDGQCGIEVGIVGYRDFAGIPIVLGTGRTPHRCIVQVPGEALRIHANDLQLAMAEIPALRRLLLSYVQASMVQSAQLVVCNTRHSVRERLARWLLVAHDRSHGDALELTHHSLSRSLGVRRAGVTTAMGRMEEAGLIRRGRGRVLIANREALEAEACECYQAIRLEHQRIVCQPVKEQTSSCAAAEPTGPIPHARPA